MTTDPLTPLRAGSTALADLNDHRTRRADTRTSPQPAAPTNVTVLVIAVPGSVDPDWLREFTGTHLLAAPELAPARVSVVPYEVTDPPSSESSGSEGRLSVDHLTMDLDEMQVSLAGRCIEFTHQEFLLLKSFMRSPRRVLSRQQLLQQAWDYSDVGSSRTVDVHIRRVRVKLGPDAPRIVTVRGFGYRLEPQQHKRPHAVART